MTAHAPDGLDEIMQVVEAETRETQRSPAMEIIEEHGAFTLSCDLPGAAREDIRVDVSPHRCVVACLPRSPLDTAARGAKQVPYQDFERAVPLPSEVDPEGAEARLNNGVLEVFLPKRKVGGEGVYRLPAL